MKKLMQSKTPIGYILGALGLFLAIALLYNYPVMQGKQLLQHDIVQYKGGAKELIDHREATGQETYWSDAMFGGMPTYQSGAQFRGDFIKQIDNSLNFYNLLPKPANYLFLLFSGFFFLGMVLTRSWKFALMGALMFGFSTYFYIIITAGHNGKLHTICYFAPWLASVWLIFKRQYWWGFVLTSLFFGLQICANHPQMTYYMAFAIGLLCLVELINILKSKDYKHLAWSFGLLVSATAIGVGLNAQRIMANAEYVKETTRGKHILPKSASQGETGLDKESILNWSYGKTETLNLIYPNLMGGASSGKKSEKMMEKLGELVQENAQSQGEVDNIIKAMRSPSYWGEQPGTSGPAYQGMVMMFVAILGFCFLNRKHQIWLGSSILLCLFLAWGSNMLWFSELFIDHVPMYNKFRAPSSILVVLELLFPMMACFGLYHMCFNLKITPQKKLSILYKVAGVFIGLGLIFLAFGKSIFGFQTDLEKELLPSYIADYLVKERGQMFRSDVLKSILFIGLSAALVWAYFNQKIKLTAMVLGLSALSVIDLWLVNLDYLNPKQYVEAQWAQKPFPTELSDDLMAKAESNEALRQMASQTQINGILKQIKDKDKGHYRVFNEVFGPFNETNTSYFHASVGGYHAAKLRRYDDVVNHYFMNPNKAVNPNNVLNMLNTKYVVSTDKDQKPAVQINPQALGNAWLVSDIQWAKNPTEELTNLDKINPKTTAILAQEDQNAFQAKTLQKDTLASISLQDYKADALSFKSQSKTPQLAVFSEVYYPKGWQMYLDNQPVPHLKANYFLRAVYVPAGQHNISMKFEPAVIEKGKIYAWLSILMLIVSAFLLKRFLPKTQKTALV
jgi:hypothetical protein